MLRISVVVTGMIQENCYIAYDDETLKALIVDPGDWGTKIISALRSLHLESEAILLTHGHFDHVGAVHALREEYPDIPLYACLEEKPVLEDPELNAGGIAGRRVKPIGEVTYLRDGDTLELASTKWRLIHTPGHTSGSASYYCERYAVVFTGDTLFAGSCGRTDLPTGDTEDIVRSIREVLMLLPDDTAVFPGHGPSSTIGIERQQNFIMRM